LRRRRDDILASSPLRVAENLAWGDAFVAEWQAFYANVVERRSPKTSPADVRQDLELFRDMIALMRG
jgi:hypothetical protein